MFARDGIPVIIGILFIALVLVLVGYLIGSVMAPVLYVLAVGLAGFTLFFFRDPDRRVPEDAGNLILAPADGTVLSVVKEMENNYMKAPATRISIFLSLFDVHVNRIPVSGTVEYLSYHPGKYLMAWKDKSSSENERSEIGVLHASGTRFFFKQITGFVARRIVFHIAEQDDVQAGKRFGMMRFGSRMDVFLPEDMHITVEKGDKVTGGETILARIG